MNLKPFNTSLRLNFPVYQFKLSHSEKGEKIFDALRGKYVALTPEEWVRQHLIRYLIEEKNYPSGLIGVEMTVKVNRMLKRSDVIVFDKKRQPLLIAECKSPSVPLTQGVFDQIARYNMPLKAKYLVVTNGLKHFCCIMNYREGGHSFVNEIPEFT